MNFALHMAKEIGYVGEQNCEDIKQFITSKYHVKFFETTKYKMKFGATFKPDPDKVYELGIYSKNEWYLIETVLFRIKSGDWKLDK